MLIMAGIGDFGEPRAGDTRGHGAADFGQGQAVMFPKINCVGMETVSRRGPYRVRGPIVLM